MVITRTPFRISFFGGGTDHPSWYLKNGGQVLSTTIDKYCYINCRYLPPFFDYKHRIVYTLNEMISDVKDIRHPSVRECLKYMGINNGMEIHYDGDLPNRSGLGTSSSFTVGLLHALHALKGRQIDKYMLTKQAIEVEQDMIKEMVGSQDQTAAAYGGFNQIKFLPNGNISVNNLVLNDDKVKLFKKHLMLFFTGFTRIASELERKKINNIEENDKNLKRIGEMVDEAVKILNSNDIRDFGKLLDKSWQLKKKLADGVSTDAIDEIYNKAKRAGAIGGKLLGAGGGGFMLFFAEPDKQHKIRQELNNLLEIPFEFENEGSRVIFYKPEFSNNYE